MTPHRPAPRNTLILAILFAGAFVMGCAEMIVVGLLDRLAVDLSVTVAAAGALVTANAAGLALAGPLAAVMTARFDRRHVLLATLVVFVLGNLLPAFGADYPVVVIARVVVGAAQGLFIAAAMVTATSVSPPERAGRAVAVVITGFAASTAFGLPIGTWLGQAVGWRGSFVAIVAVAMLVLIAAFVALPRVPSARGERSTGLLRFALAPRVLAVLGLAALIFAAMHAAVTYLVPFLAEQAGVTGAGVGGYLLAYGVATVAGSLLGGRFADLAPGRTLVVGAAGVTASLLALLGGGHPVVAVVAIAGVGLFGMATGPSLQHRTVTLAGPGAAVAAAFPASAINAGIALGAAVGGAGIELAGPLLAVLGGVALGVVATATAWATGPLRPAASAAPPALHAGADTTERESS